MLGVALALEGTLVDTPADFYRSGVAHVSTESTIEARNRAAALRQSAAERIGQVLAVRPGARELLAELERLALPSAIVGSGYSTCVYAACEELGFNGNVLSTEDLGAQFPMPAVYAAVTDTLRLPADRIWFVTSSLGPELRAAYTYGFAPVYVGAHDPGETVRAIAAWVPDLVAVLDVLKEPYTRALLELRYTMRTTLQWRPGHVILVNRQ